MLTWNSWVYIPAYRTGPGHGWFMAQDTGGAIRGRHLDVFRPPPANPSDPGVTVANTLIYVLPPGTHLPASATSGATAAQARPR